MRSAPKWIAAYLVVVAAFLAMVARYYHPAYGFTAFLEMPASSHDRELPAVRSAPHYDHPRSTGYDGQFYAQLAVDPLLRDPAIDQALDNPPYRAHRILFSWIAWALGAGRPAWILQAASLENVLAWLVLAWVLALLIPPTSARHFVLWTGCLLSHGTLMSVRYALPDGLSLLLIVAAALLVERGPTDSRVRRHWSCGARPRDEPPRRDDAGQVRPTIAAVVVARRGMSLAVRRCRWPCGSTISVRSISMRSWRAANT